MSVLDQILKDTKELYDHLNTNMPKENRLEYINRINELLDEREQFFQQIPADFTEEERKMNHEIILLNKKMSAIMTTYFNEIKSDIRKLKQGKQTMARYGNPYDAAPADGMFYDKKK